MTRQREKNNQGEGDGGKEEVWVRVKLPTGKERPLKVEKGTRLKDLLGKLGHAYVKGMTYRLNDVLLQTNQETGELIDNPILEENGLLLVEQTFQGGSY
jgi:hypothetical protein